MFTSRTNRLNTFLLLLLILMAAAIMAILANRTNAGPLDPPGPPSSTAGVLQPGTPITSIPYLITTPGYYYLTGNFTASSTDGITVDALNVTLDLKGFTLTGGGNVGTGILAESHYTVIENGHLTGWHKGIDTVDATVSNLTTTANGTGMTLFATTVDGCTVDSNSVGIDAYDSVIDRCVIEMNSTTGVKLENTNELHDNHIWSSGSTGLFGYDIEVHGNDNVLRQNYGTASAFHPHFIGVFPGASANLIIRNRYACAFGIVDNGTGTFIPNGLTEDTNYCF
jgi:hypothetical protein